MAANESHRREIAEKRNENIFNLFKDAAALEKEVIY